MIFAPLAMILLVFCLVKLRVWYTTSYTKFANLIPKNQIITQINKLGRYARRSHRNCSTSLIQITIIASLKNTRNM